MLGQVDHDEPAEAMSWSCRRLPARRSVAGTVTVLRSSGRSGSRSRMRATPGSLRPRRGRDRSDLPRL